jgi:hypothetical protein
MRNQHRHVEQPTKINLFLNGDRVQFTAAVARLLTLFADDGMLTGESDPFHIRSLTRHGWAIRARGSYQLTPAGREVRAALIDYYARKQAALDQERP